MSKYCAVTDCQLEYDHIHATGATALAIELSAANKEIAWLLEGITERDKKIAELEAQLSEL